MEENEKKTENFSAEQNNESREGYQSTGRPGGYQNYRTPGRSPRPRINTGQRPRTTSYDRTKKDEGGFRPEGFGAGLQAGPQQRPSYRPRYNNEGGYNPQGQQRGGYQQIGRASCRERV